VNQYIKDIIKISWPIIVGQLGMVLTGFFDTLMVGSLGHEELAAAGVTNSIFFLVAIFTIGVTMAFATIVGILQGKNKTTSYKYLARDSFIVTLILTFLSCIVIYFAIQNFEIFNQTPEVEALSKPYLTLLLWSLTPMLIFMFAKHICDGFSFTLGGMVITLSALVINIFFNWVFIFGNLGAEASGLNGAGYATIISRIYLAIAMLFVMFRSSKIPFTFSAFIKSFSDFKRITFFKNIRTLGFPTGLQFFFEFAAFAAAAIMAGWLGSEQLAAHNLAITLATVTYMFASGISAGSSICVAKAVGNENAVNIKQYGRNGHKLGIVVMSFFAVILLVFNTQLAGLFSQEEQVVAMGSQLLILAAIFQLGDGIQAVSVGLLRGISDVNIPSFLVFVAYWIIAMPLGYILSHSSDTSAIWYGVNGIWIGLSIGLTLSAIVLTSRFYYLLRNS
jgi:MATE family multidrug resistance protein